MPVRHVRGDLFSIPGASSQPIQPAQAELSSGPWSDVTCKRCEIPSLTLPCRPYPHRVSKMREARNIPVIGCRRTVGIFTLGLTLLVAYEGFAKVEPRPRIASYRQIP